MKVPPQKELSIREIRPRFSQDVNYTFEELKELLEKELEKPDAPINGKVHRGYASFFILPHEQHYWSPQLSVTFEENEYGPGTHIRGLYGPKPAVWTMLVFFYAILGFATLVVTIMGFGLQSLNKDGSILWLVPILLLGILSIYIVGYLGKKKGYDQIVVIHNFFEKAIGESF
ncbi:MAG: hypothetical protein ACPGD5_07535 [Salibacteraceae bacterium]